jgi:molybdate transport system substrate-binding protein
LTITRLPGTAARRVWLRRATCALCALWLPLHAYAGPGELAIWCAPVMKSVVAELASRFERETGHAAIVKSGTVEQLLGRSSTGEPPDEIMFPDDVMDGLLKGGKIIPASRMAIGRVGIGIAVRKGTAAPDISSPDALRKVLVQARSIAYPDPREGPAGGVIADAMKTLGIADSLRDRTRLGGIGQGVTFVGYGDVDLALDQATEIAARPAVLLVGLLPGGLQRWAGFGAAVSADSTSPQDARPFLDFLSGKVARDQLRAAGFEPPP